MSFGSKRGAALAIVVVVTAALLILSAALVSSASFNLSYSQNSLQDRQAYLDAKSAIEFGRAYVVKNPTSGDFKVNLDRTDYTFSINKGAATANTVAAYESAGKILKASAKDKTLDRFKTLGYRFQFSEGASSNSPLFISTGMNLGNTTVFNSNGEMACSGIDLPVFSNKTVRLSSSVPKFKAPQMYFMCKDSENCIEVDINRFSTELDTDFIYFNGNIKSKNMESGNAGKLILNRYNENNNLSGKYGIAYFNQTDIYINDKKITEQPLNGYYKFEKKVNLFDVNTFKDLVSISEDEIIAQLKNEKTTGASIVGNKNFVEANYDIIIPGDPSGAKWTSDRSVLGVGNDAATNKVVYVYVVECGGNWNNLFNNSSQRVLYRSKEMYWNYVNAQTDFVVPEGKSEQNKYSPNTLVFQAEHISLNTQKHNSLDDDSGEKPKIVGKKGASFFMMPLDTNAKEFDLTIPTELEIKYSDTNNNSHEYTINETGTYHIKIGQGSKYFENGFNLFSQKAEDFFNDATPSSGGGSGGSGGTTVTGGEYTDGK